MFKHRLVLSSAVLAVLASAFAIAPAQVAAAAAGGTRAISAGGTTSIRSNSSAGGALQQPEIRPGVAAGGSLASPSTVPSLKGPDRSRSSENGDHAGSSGTDSGARSIGSLSVQTSFDGLNHFQNRFIASGGNQFSLEPPDQGLCVGGAYVVEVLNDVIAVYDKSGNTLAGPDGLNHFLGYAPAFDRSGTNPNPFGPFVTDPSCYFDSASQRWYADVLTLEVFSDTGNFTGQNHLDLAVSQTSSPLGSWTIYHTDVTDDGTNGTPNHNCSTGGARQTPTHPHACLGDYPHLGMDANGVYLTTNEYSFFGPEFHGAQVYAYSKAALARHQDTVDVTQISTQGMDNGNSGFTLWPANASGAPETAANGTEYFLSSNAADEAHGTGVAVGPRMSTQLLVWALTNTSSLNRDDPEIQLSHTVVPVGLYAFPPQSNQKAGNTPLADCLNDTTCATVLNRQPDPFTPETESVIDSNDTRMQQVTFAGGLLWGALDTALKVKGHVKAGVEFFVVRPSVNQESVGASIVRQGYLGLANNNLIYPAIGVTPNGQGVMAFTVAGADFYPSSGFAAISANGVGNVQIAKAGLGPDDGFTDYKYYGASGTAGVARPRWGDYGAAVPDGNTIWIASEYIGQTCDFATYKATSFRCGNTRTALANWGTRISRVSVGGGND